MKYVGIRGHRGAGKTTFGYILGRTINYITTNGESPSDEIFKQYCDEIINDEKMICNIALSNIYFESFSDTLKVFIGMLLGISQEVLFDDYYKDHMVINIKNFNRKLYEEIPSNIKLYTSEELYEEMLKAENPSSITKNYYITLREFILYFGMEVMQRFFGLNVWVKSLQVPENVFANMFDDNSYKIFTDIKTSAENSYIKSKNGTVIKISRPKHKKGQSKLDKLPQDNNIDFALEIDDIYNIKDKIIEIANEIINKDEHEIDR